MTSLAPIQLRLPVGYPDELLYGIVSRLGASLGIFQLDQLVGTPRSHHTQISPHGLAGMKALVRMSRYNNPSSVMRRYVLQHSPLGYLVPFLPPRLATMMLGNLVSSTNHVTASLLPQKFYDKLFSDAPRDILRWCRACYELDEKEYGEPFWHLSHQLPCTVVCARHGCSMESTRTVRHLLPRPQWNDPASTPSQLASETLARLRTLSAVDAALAAQWEIGFVGRFVARAYERHLGVTHVPADQQCVRLSGALLALRDSSWKQVLGALGLFGLSQAHPQVVAELMLNPLAKRQNTALHVIVSTMLGCPLDEIIAGAHRPDSGYLVEDSCGSRFCLNYRVRWTTEIDERAGISSHPSMAECPDCGFSATSGGGYSAPRVRTFGASTVDVIRELLRDGIRTPHDIARATGMPVSEIIRILPGIRQTPIDAGQLADDECHADNMVDDLRRPDPSLPTPPSPRLSFDNTTASGESLRR
jgi:hypothetical protein